MQAARVVAVGFVGGDDDQTTFVILPRLPLIFMVSIISPCVCVCVSTENHGPRRLEKAGFLLGGKVRLRAPPLFCEPQRISDSVENILTRAYRPLQCTRTHLLVRFASSCSSPVLTLRVVIFAPPHAPYHHHHHHHHHHHDSNTHSARSFCL